ncbi:PulJ/GspJ family protein [Natronospora cellulosivora (SeqCode)]
MKKIDFFNRNNAFTLTEILLAIAMSGVIFLLIASLYLSGIRSQTHIQIQQDTQQDLRLIANFLNTELGNAIDFEILEIIPESPDENQKYLYIENDSLYIKSNSNIRTIGSNNIKSINFKLYELQSDQYRYLLEFNLNEDYASTIILKNFFENYDSIKDGSMVSYRSP